MCVCVCTLTGSGWRHQLHEYRGIFCPVRQRCSRTEIRLETTILLVISGACLLFISM